MITLKESEKNNCASCKLAGGKCPLGSSVDFCFLYFIMYLQKNNFTDLELKDIKSISEWREFYSKDKSNKSLAEAYAHIVSISVLNSKFVNDEEIKPNDEEAKIINDKKIIMHAFADTFLNELIPGSRKNSAKDISKISKIVPWFISKNKLKKRFDLTNIISLEKSYKPATQELFYKKEYVK